MDGILKLYTLFFTLYLVRAEYGWPSGTYGLPEPASGCPFIGSEDKWKRGYTYHNTEDENPANKRSQSYHFAANFSQHGIQQRFCIKDQPKGAVENWPDGKYCIYKKDNCPTGLESGFIKWDDEHRAVDSPNKKFGILPDGQYEKQATVINYCCNSKGDVNNPISLPNVKPFYLMANGGPQCQRVAGTKTSLEFIKFDDNDRGSTSSFGGIHPYGPEEDLFNTKVYYCYYEPGEESTEDLGTGKKQIVNERAKSSSGLAVAIGCGVAGLIVGTASIAFATKRILASKAAQQGDDIDAAEPLPDIP